MAGMIRAEYVLEWELDNIDCQHLFNRVMDADGNVKFFQGVAYSVTRSRRLAKVTAFIEACGDKSGGFTLLTGADVSMVWASTKRVFVCMLDSLKSTDKAANECVQTQIWRTEGDWKEITEDVFKTAGA